MSPVPQGINSSQNRESKGLNSNTKWPPYRHDYNRPPELENRNINGAILRVYRTQKAGE